MLGRSNWITPSNGTPSSPTNTVSPPPGNGREDGGEDAVGRAAAGALPVSPGPSVALDELTVSLRFPPGHRREDGNGQHLEKSGALVFEKGGRGGGPAGEHRCVERPLLAGAWLSSSIIPQACGAEAKAAPSGSF